jgi:hypothetical protein
MVFYLAIILIFTVFTAIVALVFSIGTLNSDEVRQSGAAIHKVGGVICSVFIFICSINVFRLLADYSTFASDANEILIRCAALADSQNLTNQNACAVLHDYQTARCMAPLLPTFVWRLHRAHLSKHWQSFRPKN